MSCSQFIDQVQMLMHLQQVKSWESCLEQSNYSWLANKKYRLTYISAKDEFMLRQAFAKVNQSQRTKAMQQLATWLDEYPHTPVCKVPEMCVSLLNRLGEMDAITEANLSRINSFRASLRRLSIFSNKVAPLVHSPQPAKRCVKFNDRPTVYCIGR